MPIHLYNLLLRSFQAVPASLGATWLGLFFPLWGFLLTQVIILVADGVPAMKTHWRQNLIRGFAVAGVAWATLYLWCVVTTTYNDHMILAAKTRELYSELGREDQQKKDAVQKIQTELGSQLSTLRENCARTEGANGALKQQTVAQQNSINNCQTEALKLLVPAPLKITGVWLKDDNAAITAITDSKLLILTNQTIPEPKIQISCTARIDSISTDDTKILGTIAWLPARPTRLTANSFVVFIQGQGPLTPEHPALIAMRHWGRDDNFRCNVDLR
jgi:hypothetical protein